MVNIPAPSFPDARARDSIARMPTGEAQKAASGMCARPWRLRRSHLFDQLGELRVGHRLRLRRRR
ncbi:MAG: hypothetical protein ACTS3F_02640 [Phycisphaerales bacterium]